MARSLPRPSSGPEAVLDHVRTVDDLIVPLAAGEPASLIDAIEAEAARFERVHIHQMHSLYDRPVLRGEHGDRLRHISYFLSPVTRPYYLAGTVELVPNNFCEVPRLMRLRAPDPLVLAAASPPDAHGYFSLGTNADYVATFIGRARFFLEVNHQMPRTFGRNQIHLSQVVGYVETDRPLLEVPPPPMDDVDWRIAALVAERIPNGATIQAGIGAIPNAILASLRDHRDLGIHTELLSDGWIDLVESGAATGINKTLARTKAVGTFALGTKRIYDFLRDNPAVELWPVDVVNDPRFIAREPNFVSINATLAVDFLGQCASETIDGRYWSSSGGQPDFARGATFSEGGQGFIALRSTTSDGQVSRIRARHAAGDVVTTSKNVVDKIVTEWGVAELRGRSIAERTRALIAIAHPDFRDQLEKDARELGFLH